MANRSLRDGGRKVQTSAVWTATAAEAAVLTNDQAGRLTKNVPPPRPELPPNKKVNRPLVTTEKVVFYIFFFDSSFRVE